MHTSHISPPPVASTAVSSPQAARQLNCVHACNTNRTTRRIVAQAAAFEPQVDSQALTAQLVVLSATAATAAYWWWSVVPSARRTLAKEKRTGALNQYLLDLQSNPDKRPLERWFYTDWLQQLAQRQEMARAAAAKRAASSSLTQPSPQETEQQQQQQQQQQPDHASSAVGAPEAVDDDKQPSFWSLDNPILATATMLAAIALISSVLHG